MKVWVGLPVVTSQVYQYRTVSEEIGIELVPVLVTLTSK